MYCQLFQVLSMRLNTRLMRYTEIFLVSGLENTLLKLLFERCGNHENLATAVTLPSVQCQENQTGNEQCNVWL